MAGAAPRNTSRSKPPATDQGPCLRQGRHVSTSNAMITANAATLSTSTKNKSDTFIHMHDHLPDTSEGPQMIVIPAGKFVMGSPASGAGHSKGEGPQHEVVITRPFALARYPTTFSEYDVFVEAIRREPPDDSGWGRGKRPVINVSWGDAQAYAQWVSEQTGKKYRLPS